MGTQLSGGSNPQVCEYGGQVQFLVLASGVWCPAVVVQPESRHSVVVNVQTDAMGGLV